ncbi:DUF488 family protein [Acidomonas methanolica]|nr:DUF488 family protein [Acidomonas methanolica]
MKESAPNPALRERFGHGPARWTEFGCRYRAELTDTDHDEAIRHFEALLKHGPITLLHAAPHHALILAAYLRIQP